MNFNHRNYTDSFSGMNTPLTPQCQALKPSLELAASDSVDSPGPEASIRSEQEEEATVYWTARSVLPSPESPGYVTVSPSEPEESTQFVDNDGTRVFRMTRLGSFNSSTASIRSSVVQEASMLATASPSEALRTPREYVYEPTSVKEVKRFAELIEGGDAYFNREMELVLSKLVIALSDPDSYYLYRDFAGHFLTLLHRFGPDREYMHSAPPTLSWALKLLMPFLRIQDSPNADRCRIFNEVCIWACNMCSTIGSQDSHMFFSDGIWGLFVNHLASSNPSVTGSAYCVLKAIVTSCPITHELVNEVLYMENYLCNDEALLDTTDFRIYKVKLLRALLEGLLSTELGDISGNTLSNVDAIYSKIELMLFTEHSEHVKELLMECLRLASTVNTSLSGLMTHSPEAKHVIELTHSLRKSMSYGGLNTLPLQVRKREGMPSPSQASTFAAPPVQKLRKRDRIRNKLRLMFRRRHETADTTVGESDYGHAATVSIGNLSRLPSDGLRTW